MPPCDSASLRDLYASAKPVYLPTMPISILPSGSNILFDTCDHIFKSISFLDSNLKYSRTLLSRPSFKKLIGTS